MTNFEYRMPTDGEILAIRAEANRLRAEATRDMIAALGRNARRLFARAETKPAGEPAAAR